MYQIVRLGAVFSTVAVDLGHQRLYFRLLPLLLSSLRIIYAEISKMFCISCITNN